MVTIKRANRTQRPYKADVASAIVLFIVFTACQGSGRKTVSPRLATLTIGFGLAAGADPEIGIQQVARNIALEELVSLPRDGRLLPGLAESWSVSTDRLSWRIRLRPSVNFHDGRPAQADAIREILQKRLPEALGPAIEDIAAIKAVSNVDLEFTLRRPSAFLMEALGDVAIEEPRPGRGGTGPFYVVNQEDNVIEMNANKDYYGGKPLIDRLVIRPYISIRSAWADMLRGQVDMLYDVGVDALDSLTSSNEVDVFTFQRAYSYMLLLNVRRPYLRDPLFRRQLNTAIDRNALIGEALGGHGAPAEGPVWPGHWAYSSTFPRFTYDPRSLGDHASPIRVKCLFVEQSHERLALVVQRQLQAIGVDLQLELVPAELGLRRLQEGDFDAFLADYREGPNLVRPYLFWHSGGPNNWGGYSNEKVDSALDNIRHAVNDAAYEVGVATFQRAIIEDPPAIFLAWRERARAVSRRFIVPPEQDVDIITSLHLWRPASDQGIPTRY